MAIPIKLLMTWDIVVGHEEACFAFITQELPTTMQQAGLELTDVWFTAYGDWPQIRVGFVSAGLQELEVFMTSEAWRKLKRKLLPYTRDYRQKVVLARGGFQF
jgi:hypothetical protein